MGLAWLQQSPILAFESLPSWLGGRATTAVLAALVVAAAGGLLLAAKTAMRRRRAASARTHRVHGDTERLKEELRQRLTETGALLADGVGGAPTMGATQAFESDVAAAARTLLLDASGQRAKAKQLLRRRVDANGAGNGLNGSEVLYWRQLGALSLLDSTADAAAAYARAAALAPGDAEAQMLSGILYLRTGNLAAAEAAFRRQIELGEAGDRNACYRGHTMLGDVYVTRQDHDAAMAQYEKAQREVKALLERAPEDVGLARDLSVACDRIGDVHAARLDLDAALGCYRDSLAIAEALAKRDAANPVWQHDLSVSLDRIGDVLDRKGDGDAALASFRKGLAIAEALARRDPGNLQWQWDLSVSLDRIGDILIGQGRRAEALESYGRGLGIAEALVRRDPGNVGWQRDLAVSYHKIGSIEAIANPVEAREHLVKGRAIIDRLARIATLGAQWRSDLSRFDEMLRSLDA